MKWYNLNMLSKATGFEFQSYQFSSQKNQIYFHYQVKFADGKKIVFTETINLPQKFSLPSSSQKVFEKCLQSLHLVLGISYWKLFLPKKITIGSFSLTKDQTRFWNTVYTKGLGEFFLKNKIKDFSSLIKFPYKKGLVVGPQVFPRKNRYLVAVGGGKDSIVTIEIIKKKKLAITGLVVETGKHYPLISQVIQQAKISSLIIRRTPDSKLFELNKRNDVYQGHVPISAIYTFLSLLTAVVYDYRYLVLSNERSSDEGNVKYCGQTINHQWSKSSEFGLLFNDYIKNCLTPDIKYFSLLRSWYELRIAQEFVRYPKYWSVFSSCNRNFSKNPPTGRWCNLCPKCASVFLLLAPFIPKEKLVKIFGKNLFDDPKLIPIYKGLLGLTKIKPFECVGTVNESRLAFYLIWQKKDFSGSPAVKMFEKEILSQSINFSQLKNEIIPTYQ